MLNIFEINDQEFSNGIYLHSWIESQKGGKIEIYLFDRLMVDRGSLEIKGKYWAGLFRPEKVRKYLEQWQPYDSPCGWQYLPYGYEAFEQIETKGRGIFYSKKELFLIKKKVFKHQPPSECINEIFEKNEKDFFKNLENLIILLGVPQENHQSIYQEILKRIF